MKIIDNFKDPQYSFLSNFYPSKFYYQGYTWDTVEHAFQAEKTILRKESDKIRLAPTPAAARKLGKAINLRCGWNDLKITIMRDLVYQKFSQNPIIAQQLLDTGDTFLVEKNNWGDRFWGQTNGVGKNWLGRILMETRDHLRKENQS